MNTDTIYRTFVNAMEEKIDDIAYAGYGEYPADANTVILGDWWQRGDNGASRHIEQVYPRVVRRLQDDGIVLDWHDEFIVCERGKAWRTTGDSYGWVSKIAYLDGDILTPDDDFEDWLEYAKGNANKALRDIFDYDLEQALSEHGFVSYNGVYENGFHPGQNDDPRKIARSLPDDVTEFVFAIDSVGQFDIHFKLYVKREEEQE